MVFINRHHILVAVLGSRESRGREGGHRKTTGNSPIGDARWQNARVSGSRIRLAAPGETREPRHGHPRDGDAGRRAGARARQRPATGGGAAGGDDGRLRPVAQASPQGSGCSDRILGLSQADDRLCAGDRLEAVERCPVRRGRERGLLSGRSLDDPHLVDGGKRDLLDQEADLNHQPVHDVLARESLAPRGRPSLPVDLTRYVRARHERRHQRRRAGQFRLLQDLPDFLLSTASWSVRGRGPVFRQSHERRPQRRGRT